LSKTKGSVQEFRPDDLPRILEEASPKLLDKVARMAIDTIEACGETRPSMVADALQTIDDVLKKTREKP